MEDGIDNFDSRLKINEENNDQLNESEEFFSEPEDDEEEGLAAGKSAGDEQDVDEAAIIEKEKLLSDVEKEDRKSKSLTLKELGNVEFKNCNYEEALNHYTDALSVCLLIHSEERAVLYSNRAAAYIKLSKDDDALQDCTKAVGLNPSYVRARLRRAELYEKMDKLDEAFEDYKQVLEQDPGQHGARSACMRLPEQIRIRNEKLKDEMLGKLKDLGNMVLRPFGLSTDNFNLQQDPNTGSYSINFKQNSSRSS